MPIITLISDYGNDNTYQAIIKGTLYALSSEITIVDISHGVRKHDVREASFLLKNAFHSFPVGTIHLICVDSSLKKYEQVIIAEYEGHYFIGLDNGIFSLLFQQKSPVYYIVKPQYVNASDLFPEKNVFTKVATELLKQGEGINKIAEKGNIRTIKENLTPVIDNNMIRGSIMNIDGYMNVITDINKPLFEEMRNKWPNFNILYRRRAGIRVISQTYDDDKAGDVLALFNDNGYMEIAIRNGQAKNLLGLSVGAPIIIEFND